MTTTTLTITNQQDLTELVNFVLTNQQALNLPQAIISAIQATQLNLNPQKGVK